MSPANTRLALLLSTGVALGGFACSSEDPIDSEDESFPDGKADGGIDEGSPEALAVLALVNDPNVTVEELDDDAALHRTAAENIVAERPFATLAELDAVPFVGPVALERLLAYAIEKGLLPEGGVVAEVVFSPKPLDESHTARIAELIDDAEESIDIAMYSYSSAAVSDALEAAVNRGVDVRFIFETANSKDKKLTGSDLQNSKSGRLENIGVDVRHTNKIMHHKYVIIDGPRDDLAKAQTAFLATGSANWSTGGATIYDENTIFLRGVPEALLRYQREFDHLWEHSTDLVANDNLQQSLSAIDIEESDIIDDPNVDAHMTSDNFNVSSGGTTFRTDKDKLTVADAWVEAIEGAQSSIWLASGHMRLKPVAEALMAKKQADPSIDIRVYLDQQEYLSNFSNDKQIDERDDCLAQATDAGDVFDCENKSFLWGKTIGDADIDVRYKVYSYRWHFSYAVQMHHKYMIIDGDELLSGSYNLSINAEHGTFENVLHVQGPQFAGLVDAFEQNFLEVWETGDGLLDDLRDEIETADPVPLVFDSMALTWEENTDLKELIRDNCGQINSDDFRKNPQNHKVCPRN